MKVSPPTVGPILGYTSAKEARVLGRGDLEIASGQPRRCFGVARLRPAEGSYRKPVFFKMNPNFDLTGLAIFDGLEADREYTYQFGWFFSDMELPEVESHTALDWSEAATATFRTGSDDATRPRSFLFGSCRYLQRLLGKTWLDDRGDKTFRSMVEQMNAGRRTDAILMVGDQVYADDLNVVSADSHLDEYNRRYRLTFTRPHVRELMSRLPTYMTLDDHEIEDNWPEKCSEKNRTVKYPAAVHAYLTYQMSHSPLMERTADGRLQGVPEHFHYRFQDGCCDFFVTDTRTERYLVEDDDEREIISSRQMEALEQWLADGSGRVKFVASAVPVFPDALHGSRDKWDGFLRQRTELFDFIRREKVRRVVFLSGDVHFATTAELVGSEGFRAISLISSPFFWPYPQPQPAKYQMEGELATTGRSRYRLVNAGPIWTADNFTRVNVDLEGLTAEVYGRKGDLLGSKSHKF